MAKVQRLTGADLAPSKPSPRSSMRQRGVEATDDLVPLQFKMPREFVRQFKQAALDRDMKLNEFLNSMFHEFMK